MSGIRIRPRPSREFPSGRGQCPRLQLRGSAGITPASLSSPSGEDALSEDDKERSNGIESHRATAGQSNGGTLARTIVVGGQRVNRDAMPTCRGDAA